MKITPVRKSSVIIRNFQFQFCFIAFPSKTLPHFVFLGGRTTLLLHGLGLFSCSKFHSEARIRYFSAVIFEVRHGAVDFIIIENFSFPVYIVWERLDHFKKQTPHDKSACNIPLQASSNLRHIRTFSFRALLYSI